MMPVDQLLEQFRDDLATGELVLPTLPEVAIRLQELMGDPDTSMEDIVAVIRADVSVSARILQLANSPYLRSREPVSDLKMAVTRLGTDYLHNLVTALATEQQFMSVRPDLDRLLRRIWRHSLQVASLSQMLAVQYTHLKGEEAFVGGLIHDLGALPVIRYAETRLPELGATELEALVRTVHTELGGAIAKAWRFPPELVAVAREHEDLQRNSNPQADFVDIVQVANVQSHQGSGHPLARINVADVPAFQRLGLTPQIDPALLKLTRHTRDGA